MVSKKWHKSSFADHPYFMRDQGLDKEIENEVFGKRRPPMSNIALEDKQRKQIQIAQLQDRVLELEGENESHVRLVQGGIQEIKLLDTKIAELERKQDELDLALEWACFFKAYQQRSPAKIYREHFITYGKTGINPWESDSLGKVSKAKAELSGEGD